METTNYIALSRQAGLRRELNLVAHNIANMNTPAYKGESMMFVEYLEDTQRGQTGEMAFVQDIATIRDLKEGPMTRTENPLDLAISGRGFFTVETEDGPRYTRNGSFQLNNAGEIVTKTNAPLLDANGNPIVVPADARSIEIGEDGSIATELGPLARIEPVGFENEQLLKKRPDSLYEAGEDQEPAAAEDARIVQGMIEGSNVQAIVEMTRMIDLSRNYASANKFTESEHERILRAVRTLVSSQ